MTIPATAIVPNPIRARWLYFRHAAAFQRTFAFAALLAVMMTLLSAFIYWQTVGYLQEQIDAHLLTDAGALSVDPGPQTAARLARALAADPLHKRVGGLFSAGGRSLGGNLTAPPVPPPPLGTVAVIDEPVGLVLPGKGVLRVARLGLSDGGYIVFGRRVDELTKVNEIVSRALALAAAPLLVLAVAGGALLSHVTARRIDAVERACRKIMAGRLDTRLPSHGGKDDFSLLAVTVNRMLDEVERLMLELKSAGDAVAHELRTPLTRLRIRLDRLVKDDIADLHVKEGLGQTISDVDQLLAMTRAILRLSEIESGQRRSAFTFVDIAEIARSVSDFYGVIADDKKVGFVAAIGEPPPILGDAALLFEAIGNLVDNAIKFTPVGGRVHLSLEATNLGCSIQVVDSGPGIPPEDRDAVLRRFYSTDAARTTSGHGLGLAIVAAIMRLHEGNLSIVSTTEGSGCHMTLSCPAASIRSPGS